MGQPVFDAKMVEDLRRLTSLFDFISNPQGYKDFLAEVQKTLATMDETIAAHTTVQEAEKYLAAAKAKVTEVNTYVEEQKQALTQERVKNEQKVNDEQKRLMQRELKVTSNEKVVQESQKNLEVKLFAFIEKERELAQSRQELEVKAAYLNSKDVELVEKLQKLSELSAAFK